MAKTSNNTSAKINFSKLIEEVTEDVEEDKKSQKLEEAKKEELDNKKNMSTKKKRDANKKKAIKTDDKNDKTQVIKTLEERLMAQRKKTRGYQKSIYFDEDAYEYLLKKQNQHNLRISQVVNEIIRDAKSRDK